MSKDTACPRCHGTGIVSVQHGRVFATDSEEEMMLAFHEESCPACMPSLARKGATTAIGKGSMTALDSSVGSM